MAQRLLALVRSDCVLDISQIDCITRNGGQCKIVLKSGAVVDVPTKFSTLIDELAQAGVL